MSIKRSKLGSEVGVADKFSRFSLNLVEKFEVACTWLHRPKCKNNTPNKA